MENASRSSSVGARLAGPYLTVDGSWYPSPTMRRMGGVVVLHEAGGSWKSAISEYRVYGSTFRAELWTVELGHAHAWCLGIRLVGFASDCLEVFMFFRSLWRLILIGIEKQSWGEGAATEGLEFFFHSYTS